MSKYLTDIKKNAHKEDNKIIDFIAPLKNMLVNITTPKNIIEIKLEYFIIFYE
jgi:hypothetical protein